jgi:hypothetical protein
MPNAIYQYVYYEPLQLNGPVTRQNRNPATSSMCQPVPGITVPSTNDLATGSIFTPDVPPQSYPDPGTGTVYNFGFMTISGCVGAGETSTDYNNLPGSASFSPLIVGSQPINILVMYIASGPGGPGGGPGIYLDAFNETEGVFVDNFFVTGISPDNSLSTAVNVYGSLSVEAVDETVTAAVNPMITNMVPNSDAIFDKWVTLEGDSNPVNPVISGNNLIVGASTPADITAFAFYKDPASVYITGGYDSPAIILFTPFSATSPGTNIPIGSWGLVSAGVNYGFGAIVHNDSSFEVSTSVTFWNIPGGLGTAGTLLDTQTVTIPAESIQIVLSSVPFVNTGGHTCAVVSIDTPDTPCQFAPTSSADSINIPDPNADVAESCSAWRNTNTSIVSPGEPWHLPLGLGALHEFYEDVPVGIQFKTLHVAVDWARGEKVLEEARVHKRVYGKAPAYLIPSLRKTLPLADLKPVITLGSRGKLSEDGKGYLLNFGDRRETNFTVSGIVPADAKPGDTYLVQVTANYPKARGLAAKAVEFLEILLVRDR